MAQGPTKIRKNAGKANTERRNKPRASPNGLKNPAIRKLRNVCKLKEMISSLYYFDLLIRLKN